jgi:hypothetical protein
LASVLENDVDVFHDDAPCAFVFLRRLKLTLATFAIPRLSYERSNRVPRQRMNLGHPEPALLLCSSVLTEDTRARAVVMLEGFVGMLLADHAAIQGHSESCQLVWASLSVRILFSVLWIFLP